MTDRYSASYRNRPANSYWLEEIDNGLYLYLDPKPTSSTSVKISGSCTISGSVVTSATADFGETNSLIDYPIVIDSTTFRIVSNTSTTVTVAGTPTSSAVTYVVYEKGLEIHYTKMPDTMDSDSDVFEGIDIEATLVCLEAAKSLLIVKYKGDYKNINFAGLNELIFKAKEAIDKRNKSIKSTRKYIAPITLRSNHLTGKS